MSFARFNVQGQVADGVCSPVCVAECYIFKINSTLGRTQRNSVWCILHRGLRIQNRENSGRSGDGSLHHDMDPAKRLDRIVQDENP